MKKKIYRTFKVIAFLVILCICLGVVSNITKRKYPYQKMEQFFSQKENFDVLFFGSSHMLNGVFPTDLWNDYGIVSYNMGSHGERITTTYYNMLLALKQTTPKLVVLDVGLIASNEKMDKDRVHTSIDTYPISYTKYLAVKDIFDGKDLLDKEIEYLFNFSIYHARWDELTKEDFENISQYEKGAESRIEVAIPNKMTDFKDVETYNKNENVSMLYLRKIIEHCKQNNIEILITYLPYPSKDIDIACSKYVQTICDEYKVNYINFLSMNLVNYNIDCYDKGSHLNPSGTRKVTRYLGKYIIENYNIQDQRKNDKYKFWNKDYDKYIDLKIENLSKHEKNLNNYLMLLYGEKDIKYEIVISSKRQIKDNTVLKQLLENLDNNYKIEDSAFKNNNDKTVKITTYDNRNGKLLKTVWF